MIFIKNIVKILIAVNIVFIALLAGFGIKKFLNSKEYTDTNKILLGWDVQVNPEYIKLHSNVSGYNVVSPEFYQVQGSKTDANQIRLNKRTNKDYINLAHNNGYKVWAMFTEFSSKRANLLFQSEENENKIINQIVLDMKENKIDGINLDFEGDGRANKEHLMDFVKKLSSRLKPLDKKISIDITGYDSYILSSYYDRKNLNNYIDYFIFMGYDQYWAKSELAGSVSGISWSEENIKKSLTEIPKEKLILAIPFYVRVWTVDLQNHNLNSRAYAMSATNKLMQDGNFNVEYDSNFNQNLAIRQNSNQTQTKIWLEDETSISKRIELINSYQLAGVAAWRLGYENADTWDIIRKTLTN